MRAWVDVLAVALLMLWALSGIRGPRPADLGTQRYDPSDFVDPWALAVSPDGKSLYVASHSANRVLRLDAATGRVLATAHVAGAPASLVLDARRDRLLALCENAFTVQSLDAGTLARAGECAVDPFPCWGVLVDGTSAAPTLSIAHHHTDILSLVDPDTGAARARISTGRGPSAVMASPDGALLLVGSFYSMQNDPRQPPVVEITGIDARRARVAFRLSLEGAGLLRHGAFTPDGSVALLGLQRSKNVIPNVAVAEGWSMTHGLAVLTRASHGGHGEVPTYEARQILIDSLTEGNAEPYDVAISPDGLRAYVACKASDRVLVLDVPRLVEVVRSTDSTALAHRLDLLDRFLVGVIRTAAAPRALALSPDGKRLYVAQSLDESVGVVDTVSLALTEAYRLAPPRSEAPERLGERIFHSARHSLEGRMSCNTCHPEEHHDGLAYNIAASGLGKNRVRIKTLLDSSGTEPFKWSGINAGYYAQCGPRAARLILHADGLPPADLDHLVAYLRSLRLPPNPFRAPDGTLTAAQEHGRQLFEREKRLNGLPIPPTGRCSFCHPSPRFTDKKAFDVGTKATSDTTGTFDTPQLENLFMTRPFLHDGRSSTLEEIFTRENPDDKHGVANDLGKDDLNDLVDYMRTLGPRSAPPPPSPPPPGPVTSSDGPTGNAVARAGAAATPVGPVGSPTPVVPVGLVAGAARGGSLR